MFVHRSRHPFVSRLTYCYSAKHLHSSEEQLHSVAGSLAYVAPEVLLKDGHGKPVDIWATGVITYVLLCGYWPFRSQDVKTLTKETTEAKLEFHERYWKNVSPQGMYSTHSV
jgi:calcium/calmodulin-dependent protein kinase I